MTQMTAEVAKILRAPFPPEAIGKLPKIWCGLCREAAKQRKTCDQHRKVRCDGCRNSITDAHLHLDYVGHAETTDRLLQADATWNWEPFVIGDDGLPRLDANGGLWIRLTVAGVTRIGYGAADGKRGPDAVKETIGDAIRNAAMRFGVAIDLWGATFKAEAEAEAAPSADSDDPVEAEHAGALVKPDPDPARVRDWALDPSRTPEAVRDALRRLRTDHPAVASSEVTGPTGDPQVLDAILADLAHMVTPEQHRHMRALWRELGLAGDDSRGERLEITSGVLGRAVATSTDLTSREADRVIAALRHRRGVQQSAPQPEAVSANGRAA